MREKKKTTMSTETEWVHLEDLESQGYEVIGTIDKDSTGEDIHEIAERVADKLLPEHGDPIWAELAKAYVASWPDRDYVMASAELEETQEYLANLSGYLNQGGNEDAYWESIRRENEGRWNQDWDRYIADNKREWEKSHV